jgi:hypothetical protein
MKRLVLAFRVLLPLIGLLIFGAMPRTACADTYTLDGYSIDSFTDDDPSPGEFTITVVDGSTLSVMLHEDEVAGTSISLFTLVDTTTDVTTDFNNDMVVYDMGGSGAGTPEDTVHIAYGSETTVSGTGSGSGSNVPEPSSLAMLMVGLLGLAVGRRKFLPNV